MICITDSWCFDDLHTNNRYQLPNYVSIHQVRKNGKTGGGIAILFHKELIHNIMDDLSVHDEDTEAICLEIKNQKSKNFSLTLFTDSHLKIQKILKIILVNLSKRQNPR